MVVIQRICVSVVDLSSMVIIVKNYNVKFLYAAGVQVPQDLPEALPGAAPLSHGRGTGWKPSFDLKSVKFLLRSILSLYLFELSLGGAI